MKSRSTVRELKLRTDITGLDLVAVSELLESAGMRRRTCRQMRKAIAASHTVVAAYWGDRLVGFGRLLSDGVYYGSIWDIAVALPYRGKGVGRAIVTRLLTVAQRRCLHMTGLFTASHNFGFYERLGFSVMRDTHAMTIQTASRFVDTPHQRGVQP